jgi:hypothetical protein
MKKVLSPLIGLIMLLAFSFIICWNHDSARGEQPTNYIKGDVKVKHGSAAGVWVIAETDEVLTLDGGPGKFRKIVVTNEQGKYLIPDLPQAHYKVWVRGYGLKDSTPVILSPSNNTHNLNAELASTPQEAAQVYPGNYWFSLLEFPDDIAAVSNFPNNAAWNSTLKLSCGLCHQQGSKATRLPNAAAFDAGFRKTGGMNGVGSWPRAFALDRYGDWGTRIAGGEVPPQPPRPQGIERNVVLTEWEWGDIFTYAHDEISTDKRNPYLYPYGNVYGVDLGNDYLLITDPVNHVSSRVKIPTAAGFSTPWNFCTLGCLGTGANSGGTPTLPAFVGVYNNPANPHNPMMDANGRVWFTTGIRPDNMRPAFCFTLNADPTQTGSAGHRQAGFYDTNTGDMVLIDTCFGTHHLQFDANDVLWFSGDSSYYGWFDTTIFDSMYDPDTWDNDTDYRGAAVQASLDFERMRVDADCNDATPPTNVNGFNYGIIAGLPDGSVWSADPGNPGDIKRFDPATRKFEIYFAPGLGGPRGIDADTDGNIWTCLTAPSQVAKFDRSKCAQTCGSGNQCPEGWTTWDIPGPVFKNTNIKSDHHYYAWVDQFNTLGLGENVVYCTGTFSDSLIAFNPQTKQFTRITIPYPLNAYMRGLDGRIDDLDEGWKGRGLWVDYGTDPTLHIETKQGQIYQVQLRNSPLDK